MLTSSGFLAAIAFLATSSASAKAAAVCLPSSDNDLSTFALGAAVAFLVSVKGISIFMFPVGFFTSTLILPLSPSV